MALHCSTDYQTSFEPTGLLVQEKKFNIDFQDGGHSSHLGLIIRTIFALHPHLDTSNEVSSQLAFWIRRRKSE